MAKGGHRRPDRRKKTYRKNTGDKDTKNMQIIKDREKQARKSKSLLRQMRGMKWDEEEYSEEIEEELEDIQ
jgi:uncharacterized membrane protein